MEFPISAKIRRSASAFVKRRLKLAFLFCLVLLLISNCLLMYVSYTGYTSANLTQESRSVLKPLRKLEVVVSDILFTYKLVGVSKIEDGINLIDQLTKHNAKFESTIKEIELAQGYGVKFDTELIKKTFSELTATGKEMDLAFIDGDRVKGNALSLTLEKKSADLVKQVNELSTNISNRLDESIRSTHNFLKLMAIIAAALIVISILLAIVNIVLSMKAISNALFEEKEILKEQISSIAQRLITNAEKLMNTSSTVISLNSLLEESFKGQIAISGTTASTVQNIFDIVADNMMRTKKSTRLSSNNVAKVLAGKEIIERMSHAMLEINESNRSLEEIIQIINDIERITQLFNDVVFQTRLLSFNASVEAARAGEAGSGFAVVAAEIGTLAAQSGESAKSISTLLKDSTTKVNAIVQAITQKVEQGEKIVVECVEIFSEIEVINRDLNKIITALEASSTSEKNQIEEIKVAVELIDKSTKENSVVVESIANDSAILYGEAEGVREIIGTLKETMQS